MKYLRSTRSRSPLAVMFADVPGLLPEDLGRVSKALRQMLRSGESLFGLSRSSVGLILPGMPGEKARAFRAVAEESIGEVSPSARTTLDVAVYPVGLKQPNAWGLYDMLGNAWEWAADVWANDYSGAPTDGSAQRDAGTAGRGFEIGVGRPLRGGGWGLGRDAMRFDQRAGFELHNRCNNSGFRVARSIRALSQSK